MLFLFRGHHGPAVRALIGAVLLGLGIVLRHGAILALIGAVLLLWGLTATVSARRARRQHLGSRLA